MSDFDIFVRVFGMVYLDFFVKVLPPVLLFCSGYDRRSHFALRLLSVPFICVAYGAFASWLRFFSPLAELLGSIGYVRYFLMLAVVLLIELYLFRSSLSALLFNLLGGYAIDQIFLFIFYILSYNIPAIYALDIRSFAYYGVQAIWFAAAYAAAWFLFIRKSTVDENAGSTPILFLSIGISLFLIVFNIQRYNNLEPRSVMDYMCLVCLILFYTLILLFRSGLLKIIESEKEMMLTKKVWEEKEKSLRLTQETVNAINIKYHDLKHMIKRLMAGEDTLGLVTDITNSLKEYEQNISTGNDTLDMILTEQILKFNQNDVNFVCSADGKLISFMTTTDIISLFSNALDNAFEATIPLEPGKREIYLTVKEAVGMVQIIVENPYSSAITMQNGLPVTIKADKQYHGFGMKSISQTVNKYGGNMNISTDGGRFKLKILMPRA